MTDDVKLAVAEKAGRVDLMMRFRALRNRLSDAPAFKFLASDLRLIFQTLNDLEDQDARSNKYDTFLDRLEELVKRAEAPSLFTPPS